MFNSKHSHVLCGSMGLVQINSWQENPLLTRHFWLWSNWSRASPEEYPWPRHAMTWKASTDQLSPMAILESFHFSLSGTDAPHIPLDTCCRSSQSSSALSSLLSSLSPFSGPASDFPLGYRKSLHLCVQPFASSSHSLCLYFPIMHLTPTNARQD